MSFDFIIEGTEVKVKNYTGNSKKVIIPNFVHTICEEAFRNKHIQEIRLNEGLRFIGRKAFTGNNLKQVVVPKSMELMHRYAFEYGGNNIYTKDAEFNDETLKILNKGMQLF